MREEIELRDKISFSLGNNSIKRKKALLRQD
jgi:hypothetical protein